MTKSHSGKKSGRGFRRAALVGAGFAAMLLGSFVLSRASDHADVLVATGRRDDVGLTDLHAFIRGENIVISLCTNPNVPPSASEYVFPSDVIFRIHVDNDSQVTFDKPDDLKAHGGTITQPDQIKEDIVFQITFNPQGAPQLMIEGALGAPNASINLFTGLTDDPFTPFSGRNVGAIVLEMPKHLVLKSQSTILLWATSKAQRFEGEFQDLNGRALRSQLNRPLNGLHPRLHATVAGGTPPDVMIYDTSRPAAFPNGRELTDDAQRLVANAPENPPRPPDQVNDRPFRSTFPYLALPHPPR